MNLVRHHFLNDLRRFRWWLLVWGLALVTHLVLPLLPPNEQRLALRTLWLVAEALLAIGLVVAVIQADSLSGTTAFWLTRPTRRYHVVAAKTLFLIALLALPWLF
jgi:hypothetical protein